MEIADVILMEEDKKYNYLINKLNIEIFEKIVCPDYNEKRDLANAREIRNKSLFIQATVFNNLAFLIKNHNNELDVLLTKLYNKEEEALDLIIKKTLKLNLAESNIKTYIKLTSSINKENFYKDITPLELVNSFSKDELNYIEYSIKYKNISDLNKEKYEIFKYKLPLIINNNSKEASKIVNYLNKFIEKQKYIKQNILKYLTDLNSYFLLDNEIVEKIINWNGYTPTDGNKLQKKLV